MVLKVNILFVFFLLILSIFFEFDGILKNFEILVYVVFVFIQQIIGLVLLLLIDKVLVVVKLVIILLVFIKFILRMKNNEDF